MTNTLYSTKAISYQVNDSLLAGNNSIWANRSLTKNLVSQSAKIYANQASLATNGGWDKGKHSKCGEFTPFAKGDLSHLSKEANYPHWQGLIGVTTQGRIEFLESIKKDNSLKCEIHHLHLWVIVGYSKNALAKSSARIGVLNIQTATHDAPSVFFCVHAYAHLQFAVLYRSESMVAAAEQPQGWLVSVCASNANSTVVTTPEIGVSSGDSELIQTEIIVMMATHTQTQFKFLFLSIKRSDTTAQPCRIAVTAPNEHDARLMLVRDYILSFAGRLPAQEVAHA
ncbi:host cell division inhibitor Icd-like protein [Proteus mirabilis]|uniref:host cell division inhibitor Icd-like protein n=1 Tax=Proteus mirabilis TaxID=584 RepID=UPI0034E3DEE8